MIHKHTKAIKHATEGLIYAFRTQINYRVHFMLSVLSLLVGWYLKISYMEFMVIILMIIIGFTLETVNTAIEKTTDAISTDIREDIKIAKDVSAAAMLLFSIGSIIIATIIFLPKLI